MAEENGSAHLTELHAECEYFGGPSGLTRVDYTTLITPWEMLVTFVGSDKPVPADSDAALDLAATYGGGGGGGGASAAMGASQYGNLNATTASMASPAPPADGSSGADPSQRQIMRRRLVLDASSRVEFRFRYGDITLVTNATDQLRRAFGHIEHEVLNAAPSDQSGFEHLSKASKEEQQKNAAKASLITVHASVRQVALFVVDDSMFGAHTNVPLLSVSISNLATPVLELSSYTTKVHISAELEVQYYNINNGAWASLLEPTPFDFVLRSNKNVTMEDVVLRRGNTKAGLKCNAMNMHVTPVLVQVISRLLFLKRRLAEFAAEGRTAAADAKAAAAAAAADAALAAQRRSIGLRGSAGGAVTTASPTGSDALDASLMGLGNSSFSTDPSKPKKKDGSAFFAYTVTQQLGHDIEIEFCSSNGQRRRALRRQRIASQGSVSFDYPRNTEVSSSAAAASASHYDTTSAVGGFGSDASSEYPVVEHCINIIVRRGDSGLGDSQRQLDSEDMISDGGGGGSASPSARPSHTRRGVTSYGGIADDGTSQRAAVDPLSDSSDAEFGSSSAVGVHPSLARRGGGGGGGGATVDRTSDHRTIGSPASPSQHKSHSNEVGLATVWLGKVGTTFVNVGLPTKPRYIIVDVAISQGAKRILLRTNVSFTNKLPFGVSFKQVGCIQPNRTVTVPRDTLRKRCTFLPTVPGGAPDEICMGVSYDGLHNFFGQSFLCKAHIRKPRSNTATFGHFGAGGAGLMQQRDKGRAAANPNMVSREEDVFIADSAVEHAYFMILSFDGLKTVPNSEIIDCHATLEAPFNFVNATGQPIRVTLHYQQTVTKKGFFRSEELSYSKIDRVTIAAEERYPVTQADPFEDLYISLEILQPTGDGLTSHRSKSKHVVLVRSTSAAKERASTVKLVDSRGEELELAIDYAGKDITISCPFWVVNQTQHYLQITTTSLKKRQNCLAAGMSGDGLGPSVETPFLVHTPKMRKDPLDAHLYIRVGRHTSRGGGAIAWSQWSDKVFINAIGDLSIITCGTSGEVVTLSFSVALVGGAMKKTRVVKITPRWIVINRLKHPVTISQNANRPENQPPPVSVQQQRQRSKRAVAANGGQPYSADDTIASGLLKVLDTCAPVGTANTICIRHGDGSSPSAFCAPLSIERLGDHAINLVYTAEVAVSAAGGTGTGGATVTTAASASSVPNTPSAMAAAPTALPPALQEMSATSNRLSSADTADAFALSSNTNRFFAGQNPPSVSTAQLQQPQQQRMVAYERSYVVHVTCYSRASTLFICIDEPEKAPHLVENRTRFQVNVRQRDTARIVAVHRFHTLGFVWEDPQAPKVLQMWMSEGKAASKPIAINLDPSMLVKRQHQLSQVIRTLGGIDLYVRVRAFGGTYAISVTEDTLIDRARALPFQQYRYQLKIDAINLLAADAGRDILFLTIGQRGGGISAAVSQHRSVRDGDTDEQLIDLSVGVIQLSDEQHGAEHRVVLQTLNNRPSTLRICRRLQRMTPMLQITAFEYTQQPIAIHLADSFMYAVMHFTDSVFVALGKAEVSDGDGGGGEASSAAKKQSVFATTPWFVELSTPVASQDSIQNRVAFVEKMNISQITVSISLYRGDGTEDPIGDKLGSFVSMLIRSVSDARFDWRRIEYDNIYDRLWLLGTFLSNYYSVEFKRQLLNVVHVAGLDVMRGFVTDLLEGYFTSNAPVSMASSKAAALAPIRGDVVFRHETNASSSQLHGGGVHPAHEAQIRQLRLALRGSTLSSLAGGGGNAGGTSFGGASSASTAVLGGAAAAGVTIFKEIRQAGLLGRIERVPITVFAERVTFAEFVANVTKSEFRHFGHLALRQYLRTRDFGISPLLMCNRCLDVEIMRDTHAEENYNSVLPHPTSRHISWAELAHHASWAEVAELVSAEELVRHAETLKAGIAGTPQNVVRIDAEMARSIRQEVEAAGGADGHPARSVRGSTAAGSGDSPSASPMGSPRGTANFGQ